MEENNTTNAYDEMMGTRNVKILKSIVPFLDYNARRQAALMIQCLEFRQMQNIFSSRESSMAACAIPETTDRRSAMLSAVRQYCTPREQEAIDTILNLFCIMEMQGGDNGFHI